VISQDRDRLLRTLGRGREFPCCCRNWVGMDIDDRLPKTLYSLVAFSGLQKRWTDFLSNRTAVRTGSVAVVARSGLLFSTNVRRFIQQISRFGNSWQRSIFVRLLHAAQSVGMEWSV